jgi:hypothetical protein
MNTDTQKLVQTEFRAFAMKAFAGLNKGNRLGNDKYLKLLAQTLTRVAAGETKRLVVSMPPRHFKTFMGSICLPAWTLAHNPSAKIIILSYGQDLADKIAYAIREILRSEWYQQAFHTRVKKDRAKLMDFVTTNGGGVRSLSTASPALVPILSSSMTRWRSKIAITSNVSGGSTIFLTMRFRPDWIIRKKVALSSLRIGLAKMTCRVTS